MTTALEGGEGTASRPGALYPRERPSTQFTGGWVGPRAGLNRCVKCRPTGIRYPDRPARSQSLYRLRYPAHSEIWAVSKMVRILAETVSNSAPQISYSDWHFMFFSSAHAELRYYVIKIVKREDNKMERCCFRSITSQAFPLIFFLVLVDGFNS